MFSHSGLLQLQSLTTANEKAENFSSPNTFAKLIGFNKLFPTHLACVVSSDQSTLYHIQKVLIGSRLQWKNTSS